MTSSLATAVDAPGAPSGPAPEPQRTGRRPKLPTPLSAHGEPMLWLTGGSLAICMFMVVGLLLFVLWAGLVTFWPGPVVRAATSDGRVLMGEIADAETYRPDAYTLEQMPVEARARAEAELAETGRVHRRMLRTGNYDLTNEHFNWIDDALVRDETAPEWAIVVERIEWGRFFGFPARFLVDGEPVAATPDAVWERFGEHHDAVRSRWRERGHLEKHALGRTAREREHARLALREIEIEHDLSPGWVQARRRVFDLDRRNASAPLVADATRRLERIERSAGRPSPAAVAAFDAALERHADVIAATEKQNAEILSEIDRLNQENRRYQVVLTTADGVEKAMALDEIVRAYPANQLSLVAKAGVYLSRWWEFLTDEPRAANSEGGVFPAIIGTVIMTLIMAVLVVPFGVMAALYLREYAKAGTIVSAVRIAINNLAGVPSIVFGVFGLGFFCYGVGGFIDGGPSWAMPRPMWLVLLAVLAGTSVVAFGVMLMSLSKPGQPMTGGKRLLRIGAGGLWLVTALMAVVLVATTPFFDGFYAAGLPNPTFGKGALVWASFTLALLTLPVVIVATEEALAAVPNSMREGSYACGASKWQTIQRIVLPRAMPGIMTGAILAMARGAGEVAPLMLVGAVKLAPELPVSWRPGDHFGVDRSFMHLGFHIFDLGFQSQNSEAAKPLVFTTTLLLITLIALLNLAAVQLRSRLRRRFVGAQF